MGTRIRFVYLAHPIDQVPELAERAWWQVGIKHARGALAEQGYGSYDPEGAFEVGRNLDVGSEINDVNQAALDACGGMIAFLPSGVDTVGTVHEISDYRLRDRPVAIVTDRSSQRPSQIWALYGTPVFKNWENAVHWITHLNMDQWNDRPYDPERAGGLLPTGMLDRVVDKIATQRVREAAEQEGATEEPLGWGRSAAKWGVTTESQTGEPEIATVRRLVKGAIDGLSLDHDDDDDDEFRPDIIHVLPVKSLDLSDLSGERVARLPSRAHASDAGLDLYCSQDVTVAPGEFADVPTSIAVEIPDSHFGLVVGRSSTIRDRRLMVVQGVIDPGYRGELFAAVWNMGDDCARIERGARLAQLLILPNETQSFVPNWWAGLSESMRGSKGFGSSGT